MSRPLRSRIWFWKPSWYWHGPKTLIPFFKGGDEFNWHTICLGWTITGRVIIATRPCPRTKGCAELWDEMSPEECAAEWPIDAYGYDHRLPADKRYDAPTPRQPKPEPTESESA